MLTGALVTAAVVLVVLVALSLVLRAWLGQQGFIAERVRLELAQREAERQIQHIAYAAMQKMIDEVRRQPR